jgi:hypothetical protein
VGWRETPLSHKRHHNRRIKAPRSVILSLAFSRTHAHARARDHSTCRTSPVERPAELCLKLPGLASSQRRRGRKKRRREFNQQAARASYPTGFQSRRDRAINQRFALTARRPRAQLTVRLHSNRRKGSSSQYDLPCRDRIPPPADVRAAVCTQASVSRFSSK